MPGAGAPVESIGSQLVVESLHTSSPRSFLRPTSSSAMSWTSCRFHCLDFVFLILGRFCAYCPNKWFHVCKCPNLSVQTCFLGIIFHLWFLLSRPLLWWWSLATVRKQYDMDDSHFSRALQSLSSSAPWMIVGIRVDHHRLEQRNFSEEGWEID